MRTNNTSYYQPGLQWRPAWQIPLPMGLTDEVVTILSDALGLRFRSLERSAEITVAQAYFPRADGVDLVSIDRDRKSKSFLLVCATSDGVNLATAEVMATVAVTSPDYGSDVARHQGHRHAADGSPGYVINGVRAAVPSAASTNPDSAGD